MKSIAIITARGGSKRIPKKNIREFCGKPILAYSIEAALNSGLFDEVMVSTDSEEIADIAREYGADVPFMREAATSGDYATTSDVIMEVTDKYSEMGIKYDYICCIYPTAPFVTAKKLIEAMNVMIEKKPVEVMPIVQLSFPPQRCFVISEDGCVEYKYKEFSQMRSQDLEKQYHDAGQFYIYDAEEYIKRKGIIVDNIMPIVVQETEVQDIDNESDWTIAEIKYKYMKQRDTDA